MRRSFRRSPAGGRAAVRLPVGPLPARRLPPALEADGEMARGLLRHPHAPHALPGDEAEGPAAHRGLRLVGFEAGDLDAEPGPSPAQRRLDAADVGADDLRDVRVGHLLDLPEHEHGPLP